MSTDLYCSLIHKLPLSYCQLRGICNEKGQILEFEILEVNDCFAFNQGKQKEFFKGKTISEAFPGITDKDMFWLKKRAFFLEPGNTIKVIRKCPVIERWNKIHIYCIQKNQLVLIYIDVTLEQEAKKASRELRRFHKALFEISSSDHYIGANMYDFLRMLTPKLTEVMRVWRAGVWFFDEDGEKLRCLDNFDAVQKEHSSGMVLSGYKHNQEYFYLKKDRYVDASDAKNDIRLQGYLKNYINPLGISSMLDVGIISEGKTKGVLCIEHKGKKRNWTENEITFACRVADQISIVLGLFEKKITQNRLKQSEARIKTMFSTAPNGMGLINARVFVEVNEKFCEMTGYTREEIIGKSARMLYPSKEEYENVGKHKYEQIKEKGLGTVETQWKTKSGKIIDVLLSSSPLDPKDWYQGVTFSATDITDRNAKIKLEQQLAVATKSAEFKKNFLANMSHEMRTPLTGIIGMTEILSQTALDARQTEYISTLRGSGENLLEIINQVLDFSKIEQGTVKLNYRKTSVKSLLDDAESLFHFLCDKEITFSSELDPLLPQWISIDNSRITRIIHNLISNAVKFTHKGEVFLGIFLEEKYDNDEFIVRIEVKDTGIGINKNSQNEIFNPFMQVDQRDTRAYEGVGLGLSITKQLAILHGGNVTLESEPDEGSFFTVRIKAKTVQETHETKDQAIQKDQISVKKLNILFAEDKEVNQKVISLMLRSMGHNITIAANGKLAVDVFSKNDFDLILMDIQMPVMDGVEAVKYLRSNHKELPPIVGLSANAFEGDKEKYMAAGMDAYLTKPVKRSDLANLLGKFFPRDTKSV